MGIAFPVFRTDRPNLQSVSWDEHLDKKYGKKGTAGREQYAEEFETFKIGILIEEARKKQNLK